MFDNYAPVLAWSQDFARAMGDRPPWARLLFRLAAGRYAYREFVGLVLALKERGDSVAGYELEGCEYHREEVPGDYGVLLQSD